MTQYIIKIKVFWKLWNKAFYYKALIFELISLCSIKLGVIEDHSNRTRLAKLLKFFSSNSDTEQTSLAEYIERMKEKQEHIYFMAGTSRAEVGWMIIHENVKA